ncbi:hypothetical protein L1049_020050 [Liquidambar formosana]|uniref:Uncharacterized protein n=1 Tax=Liquidambar formosana TaxID=63359 RepID=A0AAP0SAR4_LIQFO
MDREQEEIQFLGLFGIFKESFNIIFSWRKIFTQITLALILPLSFIFLAHIEFSELLFYKILHDEHMLHHTREGTPRYSKLSDVISSDWITFWLFKAAYLLFVLILSLLSTSAVVYTVACIYTAKEITFKKVMSVVPKVWKRLMVTFIWNFVIVFAYNIIAIIVIIVWSLLATNEAIAITTFVLLFIIYMMGLVYISIVWHLASVVTVLEDSCGIKAMVKSKALIKGKMGVAVVIFLLLMLCSIGIQVVFQLFVVFGLAPSTGMRIFYGIGCLLLLIGLILFGLTIQTVVYFVCKSYHHENIDKSSLADHLEVYLGDYVPLKAKDVQLEHYQV